MGFSRMIFGAESRKDRSLPFIYEARVDALSGQGREPLIHSFFSDTLCGLIECLIDEELRPDEVRLLAIYRGEEVSLDAERCTDGKGNWLERPEICHALETHFKKTLDLHYKGHVEHGPCSFRDRERTHIGPY